MPRHPQPSRRWLAGAALIPLFLIGGPTAHGEVTVTPPWPGLPTTVWPNGYTAGMTVGSEGNGLTHTLRARQWIQIPPQAVAAVVGLQPTTTFPADDPGDRFSVQVGVAHAFLSSPAGAAAGYGIGLPITVRTVAFGAIPVQATMHVEQMRDADDLPVPLLLRWTTTEYRHSRVINGVPVKKMREAEMSGQLRVRITALSVDGVDMGVRDCVSPVIDMDLHGTPFWQGDPLHDPFTHDPTNDAYVAGVEPTFALASNEAAEWMASLGQSSIMTGGVVAGEIDIPAFAHCSTRSGENLSRLMTSVVSGPSNPVTVGTAAFDQRTGCGTQVAPPPLPRVARAPFSGDPSDCDPEFAPPTLDYPAQPTGN